MELIGMPRGELGHDPVLRLRTPETLRERGREELTGMKGSASTFVNGSEETWELTDVVADISDDEGAAGGIKIWDCEVCDVPDVSTSALIKDDEDDGGP